MVSTTIEGFHNLLGRPNSAHSPSPSPPHPAASRWADRLSADFNLLPTAAASASPFVPLFPVTADRWLPLQVDFYKVPGVLCALQEAGEAHVVLATRCVGFIMAKLVLRELMDSSTLLKFKSFLTKKMVGNKTGMAGQKEEIKYMVGGKR